MVRIGVHGIFGRPCLIRRMVFATAFGASLLLALPVLASDIYEFGGVSGNGGVCGSLGPWSQAAIAQADIIQHTAEQLKNNPNCKGIEQALGVEDGAANATAVQALANGGANASKIQTLPNEISALKTYLGGDASFRDRVNRLLLSKVVDNAATGAEATAAVGLIALRKRSQAAAQAGVVMFDQMVTALPHYDRCLVGMPSLGASILGAMMKMGAAFASSDAGAGNRFGKSLANFITILRDKRFSSILRKLDESELWLSMSCLIESTTQAYCSANDAQQLQKMGKEKSGAGQGNGASSGGDLLEGYQLLQTRVPMISTWLRNVQFGTPPKLPTDATFKNDTIAAWANLIITENQISGAYGGQKLVFDKLPNDDQKRAALLNMLNKLVSMIPAPDPNNPNSESFIASAKPIQQIPYFLIGLDSIPDQCNPVTHPMVTWQNCMFDGTHYLPQFSSPDQLMAKIDTQMKALFSLADVQANNYYANRMIVDMPNLVSDLVTSNQCSDSAKKCVTVKESLEEIDRYLTHLTQRIEQDGGDEDSIALKLEIYQTQSKIEAVIAAFNELHKYDHLTKADYDRDPNLNQEYAVAAAKVIQMAYDQFNVILQRDMIFQTRMSTFVRYDVAQRMRNTDDMTTYERNVAAAAKDSLMSRISEIMGDNPTNVQQDLAFAQVLNKRNIEAVQSLFSDNLFPTIQELDLISQGKQPTDYSLTRRAIWRFMAEFPRSLLHGGRYPIRLWPTTNSSRGGEDEFGSHAQVKARFCIQTLAFENRQQFQKVCKGSVLKSYFDDDTAKEYGLNADYDSYFTGKNANAATDTHDICAYRDFTRKNLVYWLTQDVGNLEAVHGATRAMNQVTHPTTGPGCAKTLP